jgi:hypothetical protein
LERFRGSQKEYELGPVGIQSSLANIYKALPATQKEERPEDGKKGVTDENVDELEAIITTTKKSDLSYYIFVLLPVNISLHKHSSGSTV